MARGYEPDSDGQIMEGELLYIRASTCNPSKLYEHLYIPVTPNGYFFCSFGLAQFFCSLRFSAHPIIFNGYRGSVASAETVRAPSP